MLSAREIDSLYFDVIQLYDDFTEEVIKDIARRIARLDFAKPTAALQVQRLMESGQLYEGILLRIGMLTKKSETALDEMFRAAGVKSLRFDDAIYRAAGYTPVPLNLSPAMQEALIEGIRKTGGTLKNLTRTTALTGQEAYLSATDMAYMKVLTGTFDYNTAIRQAVQKVADTGLTTIAFAGRRDQLDVAVRRALITGVSQTTGRMQLNRANEMGQDLMQVSAHIGARPTHEVWQGKIYSVSGASLKYPGLVAETGYGTGNGLMGWNCRHSMYPFFAGISEVHYQKKELDDYAKKTVTYNGEKMSFYEGTQKQREIERGIRHWKRRADALGAAGLDNTGAIAKVRQGQAKMREFIRQTGIVRQREREGGRVFKVVKPTPPPPAVPRPPTPHGFSSMPLSGIEPPLPAAPLPAPTPLPVPEVVPPKPGLPEYLSKIRDGETFASADGRIKITGARRRISSHHAFDLRVVDVEMNGQKFEAVLKSNFNAEGTLGRRVDFQHGFAKREIGASQLDQALGLDVVPETFEFVDESGQVFSLQKYVPNAETFADAQTSTARVLQNLTRQDDLGRMNLLDVITGNTDRHGNNWMVSDGLRKIHAIDNGLQMTSLEGAMDVWEHSRFLKFTIADNQGRLGLNPAFRTRLEQLLRNGRLKEILTYMAETENPVINQQLVRRALDRAEYLVANWDEFFWAMQ